MFVVGVDLSGPANQADTAAAWFREDGSELRFRGAALGWSDRALVELVARLAAEARVAVGLDASLSYDEDRPGDIEHEVEIVEVHPGASLGLRDASLEAILRYRVDVTARDRLIRWLGSRGVRGLPSTLNEADHLVAAVAAALATWRWRMGEPVWLRPADPPQHPFDFAC